MNSTIEKNELSVPIKDSEPMSPCDTISAKQYLDDWKKQRDERRKKQAVRAEKLRQKAQTEREKRIEERYAQLRVLCSEEAVGKLRAQEDFDEITEDKYKKYAKKVGARLKECRESTRINNGKKMTQAQVLRALGMSDRSRGTLKRYEDGEEIPAPEILVKLCELYQCDFGYLAGDYEAKNITMAKVCEETGLSESAVYTLRELKGSDTFRSREILKVINLLLDEAYFDENMEFWHLLYAYIWTKPEGSTDISLITVGGEVKVSKESVLSAILENNTAYLKGLRKRVSTEE